LPVFKKTENKELKKSQSSKDLKVLMNYPEENSNKISNVEKNFSKIIKTSDSNKRHKRNNSEDYATVVKNDTNKNSEYTARHLSNFSPNYSSIPITLPLQTTVKINKKDNTINIDNQSITKVREQLHQFLNKKNCIEKKI
jgi:hypothetical protein